MKYETTKRVDVYIRGRVESRKEMEKRGFLGDGENKRPYRAAVDHPNGRMEWQWFETFEEAKHWVDSVIHNYITFGNES